jgi:hypothetical protein
MLGSQRDFVLFAFAVSSVGARHAAADARTRQRHACAIVHPSRDEFAFRTAGVSPAPLNFALTAQSQIERQRQKRRPEAGGTKTGRLRRCT